MANTAHIPGSMTGKRARVRTMTAEQERNWFLMLLAAHGILIALEIWIAYKTGLIGTQY